MRDDATVEEMGSRFTYQTWKKETLERFMGPKYMVGCLHFSAETEGPPGFVHGGATFTAFDQLVGVMVHYYNLYIPHMTLTLTIDYKRPVPLSSTQYFKLRITHTQGKKVFVDGYIFDQDLDESETKLDLQKVDFANWDAPPSWRRVEIRGIFFRVGEAVGELGYLGLDHGQQQRQLKGKL
ncbi:Thioesterase super member 4 [Borealophlyctis nickersoniae]|nr:Thioesterase super member 4 [Borealophlyctis nickersoniae]